MFGAKYLVVCANHEDCFLVSAGDIRLEVGDLAEFDDDGKRIFARVVMYWTCFDDQQARRIMAAWDQEHEECTVNPIKAVYREVL